MSVTVLSESSDRAESNEASGPVSYVPSDDEDEDSSILADLTAMFPTLDHEVIVTVLHAHNGRIQAAVEYLMATSQDNDELRLMPLKGAQTSHSRDPAYDMRGQFSEDIGGLPELLPRFMYEDNEDSTNNEDSGRIVSEIEEPAINEEESSHSFQPLTQETSVLLDSDDDPLPTYEEACVGREPPPPSASNYEARASSIEDRDSTLSHPMKDMRQSTTGDDVIGQSKKSKSCWYKIFACILMHNSIQ